MASGVSHISAYSATSSALYQSTLASTGIQKETLADRMTQTKNWIYNPEEGTVMGRTPIDWALYIVWIIVFLAALIGISAAFCGVFYWVIGWNYPTLRGAASILQVPGMSFRPQPDVTSTLIRFVKGDGSTYVHYLDHIEAYIQYYENELQVGDNYMDCSEIRGRRITDLHKIFEWIPEEYTNETVPSLIRNIWKEQDPWWIIVRCDGDDDVTKESMGMLSYFPPDQGFHFKYYPFHNQQGYRSPLMFLRFENPHPGVLLMMTCRAFARNIIHDHVEQIGQVHFEMMVD